MEAFRHVAENFGRLEAEAVELLFKVARSEVHNS